MFFSLSGNTRLAAQKAAGLLDAELVELKTMRGVPHNGFLRYMVCGCRAIFRMGAKLKWEHDFTQYDEIVLGTPIWAKYCVPAVNTFIKDSHAADKVIGVFTSSGGGDNDECINRLKRVLPNMQYTAALADPRNKLSSNNDKNIEEFAEKILRR